MNSHNNKDLLLYSIRALLGFAVIMFLMFVALLLPPFLSDSEIQHVKEAYTFGQITTGFTSNILTPFIGGLAAISTFLAFIVQFLANKQQRDDIKRERAENKFYELLSLHKENVNEISVGTFKGRDAFIKMYEEFRFTYYVVKEVFEIEQRSLNRKLELGDLIIDDITHNPQSFEEVYVITAYHICFFGVSSLLDSNRSLYPKNIKPWFFKNSLDYLKQKYQTGESNLSLKLTNGVDIKITDFPLTPFEGNVGKLGHYYRHLYQLVKYTVTDNDIIIKQSNTSEWKQRYSYIKTIRAQLSNHEQALIYYNSFFRAGRVWYQDLTINQKNEDGKPISYFLDYAFIKNLPYNLVRGVGPWPKLLFRNLLNERDFASSLKEPERVIAIEKRLNWLFEWEGG
ncbi:putative phage abortive infection protein [Roseivirga pacifica]|uniref:putative phage abortive infection protein n=1 Tax=Roseivirga pacifica TaxID=1267423 RepID=UPI003BB16560